ncbi:hypothetical protein GCM10011609_44230 [Lentzea pudingi]|uniref:GNAT family N-acetyltransferase n=1 Tax=Lentzea pudingi TaxID=1789439 RepID=A0ABQ2I7A6_9PSEU|nr:DUF6368 family protein [Lentzea pudingi]GGN00841.1 hypothetical protein GCM10011609_44230 [Lentzea pudingi]
MPGPTLVVELAESVPETALREFEAFVRRHSTRFEQPRPWFFDVSAGCDTQADHVATGLPGVLGVTGGPYPTALGTAGFLRAWAEQSRFRLLK